MTQPHRIQRSRQRGWRMPEGAIYVGRPTIWGNPFTMAGCREAGFRGTDAQIAARVVGAFEAWLESPSWRINWDGSESEAARSAILNQIGCLRGHPLVCWCPLDQPCHADVLLEIANR